MANSKGPSSMGTMLYNGKHSLLPPKSPFPSISPSHVNHAPNSVIGPKGFPKQRHTNSHHQRTSSESFLIEEQPSWLDDLLNEPDTPVRRGGHRRSSSDSFAYVDITNVANIDYAAQDEYKIRNLPSVPSWGSRDFDRYTDFHQFPFYVEQNSLGKHESQPWDSSLNSVSRSSGLPSTNDISLVQNSGSLSGVQEADVTQPATLEKHDPVETGPHDKKTSFEWKNTSLAKPPASETDTKRAKQQFAQRSRVRKLQYIAELERNVQALQAEGSEVTAELEFLNQQNLILSMENKALKQRLESLAQEQLIKSLEHEVLEREIGRLQTLYQQQQQQHQQQQQSSSSHRRSKSRDLESQFGNLSLKHKEASSGQLHI